MRPVCIVKREIVSNLGVDVKSVKSGWGNPYLAEKFSECGFDKGEEYFIGYKVFSDDYIFIGVEREANRTGDAKEGTKKQG